VFLRELKIVPVCLVADTGGCSGGPRPTPVTHDPPGAIETVATATPVGQLTTNTATSEVGIAIVWGCGLRALGGWVGCE